MAPLKPTLTLPPERSDHGNSMSSVPFLDTGNQAALLAGGRPSSASSLEEEVRRRRRGGAKRVAKKEVFVTLETAAELTARREKREGRSDDALRIFNLQRNFQRWTSSISETQTCSRSKDPTNTPVVTAEAALEDERPLDAEGLMLGELLLERLRVERGEVVRGAKRRSAANIYGTWPAS